MNLSGMAEPTRSGRTRWAKTTNAANCRSDGDDQEAYRQAAARLDGALFRSDAGHARSVEGGRLQLRARLARRRPAVLAQDPVRPASLGPVFARGERFARHRLPPARRVGIRKDDDRSIRRDAGPIEEMAARLHARHSSLHYRLSIPPQGLAARASAHLQVPG